jgi:uncharacterized protein
MLDLDLLPEEYAVCRLAAGSALPDGLHAGPDSGVVSVTWTRDEVSIICRADRAPTGATVETPWRCFRVVGPLDLALTGILASLVAPLADARVNIFAFSTFDTDYLLVPAVRLAEAMTALTGAGHRVAPPTVASHQSERSVSPH